jgi:protease-4
MYRAVQRFSTSGKPVIASMDNVAASGAYYLCSACDRIFANPGTITGSIGVRMRLSRMHRLFDKVGVEFETLKAGEYKDAGSPYREMTPEERRYLQEVLDDIHAQFIEDVGAARSMGVDSLRGLAEGQIFTGRQALACGLIDTLGGYEDALAYARETAGLPADARVLEKHSKRPLWWQLLSGRLGGMAGAVDRVLYPGGIYYLYDTN